MSEQWTTRILEGEKTILSEIESPEFKQGDIAQTYAFLVSDPDINDINWAKINRAIIDRWSRSGLERIKEAAWKARQ